MAETKEEVLKRYVKMPFEIYLNTHTEKYHLIEHLGYTASGKAWSVRRIGMFDSFIKAKTKLDKFASAEGYTWE
jgi:hypothetical protein